MKRLAVMLVCVLLAGCAVDKLDDNQRAYVQCMETGRDGSCVKPVADAWWEVRSHCMRVEPAVRSCSAAFDRDYWCRTKKKIEKITNAKGETITKETETEYGPGCMDSYERSKLRDAYQYECLGGVSPSYEREGARCSCGDYSCSVNLPFFTDSVVLKYFPALK